MKTSDDIKKIVDKDLHIEILRETLIDLRVENRFIKRVIMILFGLILMLIIGMFAQGVYHQHKLFKFISETEFYSEIYMDNDASNQNNMNVERR